MPVYASNMCYGSRAFFFFFHFSSLTANYNLAKGAIGKEELSTYVPKKWSATTPFIIEPAKIIDVGLCVFFNRGK